MTKAIAVAFHKYTPFGDEYYAPILDFFMAQMTKYKNEFDKLYLFDSNWNIGKVPSWAEVIQTDPNYRYYEVYPNYLHRINEDLLLFLDNDMVIYRKEVIGRIFSRLDTHPYYPDEKVSDGVDIVSIYDNIGKTFKELGGKSKFCPYLFASRKLLFTQYKDVYWGPNMPKHETLGALTEAMLKDRPRLHEMEEDKSNLLFGEELGEKKSKDLGYYHIRAGSTPAYLLSHRGGAGGQYEEYLKNQPRGEYLRQFMWYDIMGGEKFIYKVLEDLKIPLSEWFKYKVNFIKFHGL